MENRELLELAIKARENAYAPYSQFKVGAALLTKDGKVYLGCNIENSSFSAGICAERVAFSKAISEGEKEFKKIAIVGGEKELIECCYPCGVCRQFMSDFVDENFQIVLGDEKNEKTFLFKEILPFTFKL